MHFLERRRRAYEGCWYLAYWYVAFGWMQSGGRSVLFKKNFNMQSFNVDISECHEQKPSFVAVHIDAAEPKKSIDDAMVRECMKAKGYTVQIETK